MAEMEVTSLTSRKPAGNFLPRGHRQDTSTQAQCAQKVNQKNRYYMSSPTETISVGVEIHPCKSEILVGKAKTGMQLTSTADMLMNRQRS